MTVWFTSDTHFSHARILQYCDRPFASVEEMNEELIRRWNQAVAEDDTVYHLGDFAFCRHDSITSRLSGRRHLILGNHDQPRQWRSGDWISVQKSKTLRLRNHDLLLTHYPVATQSGILQLHGHKHGTDQDVPGRVDVGVDSWGYRPIQLEEILQHMSQLPSTDTTREF